MLLCMNNVVGVVNSGEQTPVAARTRKEKRHYAATPLYILF